MSTPADPAAAATAPMVVAVEDEESMWLLQWAADHAKPGQEIVAMSVWHFPALFGVAPDSVSTSNLGQHEKAREGVEARLEKAISEVRGNNPIRLDIIESQHPGRSLVEGSSDADVLVIAAGSRSLGVGLLGGTASYCVHRAHCPVVVVRAPADEGDDK